MFMHESITYTMYNLKQVGSTFFFKCPATSQKYGSWCLFCYISVFSFSPLLVNHVFPSVLFSKPDLFSIYDS